jgi:hypothetical protein
MIEYNGQGWREKQHQEIDRLMRGSARDQAEARRIFMDVFADARLERLAQDARRQRRATV